MTSIDDIWDALLSRDLNKIKDMFDQLSEPQKKAVVNHLTVMTRETGWHPAQKISAEIALNVINRNPVER